MPSSDGFYFCDAASSLGPPCPELKLFEGNQFGFQTGSYNCQTSFLAPNTWHNCDSEPTAPFCSFKDTSMKDKFGPGLTDDGTIDTTQDFIYKVEFTESSDGKIESYTVTVTQGDNTLTSGPQTANKLKNLKITNMGLAIGYVEKDISDCVNCTGTCDSHPDTLFKSVKIRTVADPPTDSFLQ